MASAEDAVAPLHPAYLYAFERLGYFVTEVNLHLMTPEQVDEWEAALDEWIAAHPHDPPP